MYFLYRIVLILLLSIVGGLGSLMADIIQPGDLVVSGFSGKIEKNSQIFIKSDGASLKVFQAQGVEEGNANVLTPPMRFSAYAKDIGQLFGIALDNANPPNIYVTATAAYGLHIVTPDKDGDGIPEVSRYGASDATFMEGQFGKGGDAGTVWKIDGKTGEISLFADLQYNNTPNGGAGLGNIVFDPWHYQFFVSDLDNGVIYQLDMNGNTIGTYDHGVAGRTVVGLPKVEDDGSIADIHSATFDSLNSDTWGLTDIRRRVWGLGLFRNRLYYAVGEGAQIWSVGFNRDGTFANDARIEIKSVPGGFPVSDILFTNRGWMILAQRGGMLGDMKMLKFHEPGNNRVLRYRLDKYGKWIQEPQEYAIGFALPDTYANASGGVGLGCSSTLWSSGDNLRNDPSLAEALLPGGELVVHGLQGSNLYMVRPFNAPPWGAVFIDYDNKFGDKEKAGYVGDVEVYLPCGKGGEYGWSYQDGSYNNYTPGNSSGGFCVGCPCFPGWCLPPCWTPPDGWTPPNNWPKIPDLHLVKSDTQCEVINDKEGKGDLNCTFTILISNEGNKTYTGSLHVEDNPAPNASYVNPASGSLSWNCNQNPNPGGTVVCNTNGNVTLVPGQIESLEVTFKVPNSGKNTITNKPLPTMEPWKNCAIVNPSESNETNATFPEEATKVNNDDCGWAYPPDPNLFIKKIAGPWDRVTCVRERGRSVIFGIFIENRGGSDYTGPVAFTDTLPDGSSVTDIMVHPQSSISTINCSQSGTSLICTTAPTDATLALGDMVLVVIVLFVPDSALSKDSKSVTNCVALQFPKGIKDSNSSGDNSSCATRQFNSNLEADLKDKFEVCNLCPTGWTPEPDNWVTPQGWDSMQVQGLHSVLICGRKHKQIEVSKPKLVCPVGWTRYPSQASVPKGWQSKIIQKGSESIVCAKVKEHLKPLPLHPLLPQQKCHKGETKFSSKAQIPAGWKWRKVGRNGFYCARPPQVTIQLHCPSGWVRYPSRGSVPKGWQSKVVTLGTQSIVCARANLVLPLRPYCRKSETKVSYKRVQALRKKGWRVRAVTKNGITIWCAKHKMPISQRPHCMRTEKEVNYTKAMQLKRKGWRVRSVTKGGKSIWCARVQIMKQCPPGTHRVGKRCIRNVVVCPPGTIRVRNHCVAQIIKCPPGMHRVGRRCIRDVTICPRGTHRVGNRCVRNAIICPRGTHRVGNRCVKDRVVCPLGTHRVGNRCIRYPIANKPIIKKPILKQPIINPGHFKRRCPKGEEWRNNHCYKLVR